MPNPYLEKIAEISRGEKVGYGVGGSALVSNSIANVSRSATNYMNAKRTTGVLSRTYNRSHRLYMAGQDKLSDKHYANARKISKILDESISKRKALQARSNKATAGIVAVSSAAALYSRSKRLAAEKAKA